MSPQPTPDEMRHALGHFATGVTVVTGTTLDGEPVGFACQSFASVSLDPPLVLFCADHRGRSWPHMRDTGHFTVNVLHHEQVDLVQRFGSPQGRRFEGLDWYPSETGGPSLADALMRIHCTIEQVHVAGDHDVVIGRVRGLDDTGRGRPMLFYRGQLTVIEEVPSEREGAASEALDDYWG
ncbi:flavin reductase family protein [Intrasporangium sp.]|uniref:flavin reductase family protein n=1 Tax=Intrasporangium sp. TaxID=1925024 RepID=UPI00293A3F58|nr:flavin reductase family protein [Intrasporangium sp.]MDV3221524.1 flavin reductase family protein [Intrasporangium sp.]